LKPAAIRVSTLASWTLALTDGTWSLRLECIWVPRTLTRKQDRPRDATATYAQGTSIPVASPTSTESAASSGRPARNRAPYRLPASSSAVSTILRVPGGAPASISAAPAYTNAATSARANSMSSCSRAARASMTLRFRADAGLDGGVGLLIRRPAGFLDPVAARPPDALPCLEALRLDPEEPTGLLHRGLQVRGPVLTKVPIAHTGRDRHPFAPDVGTLDELRLATAKNLAERLGLLDDKRHPGIVGEVLRPSRVLTRDHPEHTVPPFVPAHGDVGSAIRFE